VGVLDVAAIKTQREEEMRIAAECTAWCVQAAREFTEVPVWSEHRYVD